MAYWKVFSLGFGSCLHASIADIIKSNAIGDGIGRAIAEAIELAENENWTGVDIMYHLDGRWRRQSLVYFGNS